MVAIQQTFVVMVAVVLSLWLVSNSLGAATQPSDEQPVQFEMAIYLLSPPTIELTAQVRGLQDGGFRDLATRGAKEPIKGSSIRFREVQVKEYAPPDERSLRFFGRGLSPEDCKRLQHAPVAWVFDFFTPRADVARAVRRACEFMENIARQNDAVIWDELTREVFSIETWKTRRLQEWENGLPNVSRHITIHFYVPDGKELPRAITLGMAKFGCPDVVVNDVPRESGRGCGNLINVVCQILVEQSPPATDHTKLVIDFHQLQHKQFRETVSNPRYENAKTKATLTLQTGRRDAGDPDNRLIELTFDESEGQTPLEKQARFLQDLFGSTDRLMAAKHDPGLLAARDRARRQIAVQKTEFLKRLPVGDVLLVKAPFKTVGGGRGMDVGRGDSMDGQVDCGRSPKRSLRCAES